MANDAQLVDSPDAQLVDSPAAQLVDSPDAQLVDSPDAQLVDSPDATSYAATPYPAMAYAASHPRRLEAMATLFGMKPQPISSCRVLELGCAGGGNLIPQALNLPESRFVGVDLSHGQIEKGRQLVRELALENVELHAADIMQIDADWGEFDYIICHGIFSWVPAEVQEKILDVCKRNLAPHGVAYVSYNTYPGWHGAGLAADLMRFHAGQFDEPSRRIGEAKRILEFMAANTDAKTICGAAFREEQAILARVNLDSYLYHDHLEQYNQPVYFWQFAKRSAAHGLQYLSETDLRDILLSNYPEAAQREFGSLPLIRQEQYIDFLSNRRFRRTLLCHNQIQLSRNLTGENIAPMHLATVAGPDKLKTEQVDATRTAFVMGNTRMETNDPVLKAALMHLTDVYPEFVAFDRLRAMALEETRRDPAVDQKRVESGHGRLAGNLLSGLGVGMLEVCLSPPRCTCRTSPRPLTNRLVRMQADRGLPLATQRHGSLIVDEFSRWVVRRLDGRHDRQALTRELRREVNAGKITVSHKDGRPVQNVDGPILTRMIDGALNLFSRAGLLVE